VPENKISFFFIPLLPASQLACGGHVKVSLLVPNAIFAKHCSQDKFVPERTIDIIKTMTKSGVSAIQLTF